MMIARGFSWRSTYAIYRNELAVELQKLGYGIEQQAEIVRHAFLLRNGWRVAGVGDPAAYAMAVRNAESKTRVTHLQEKILAAK